MQNQNLDEQPIPGRTVAAANQSEFNHDSSLRFFLFFTFVFTWVLWILASFFRNQGFFIAFFGVTITVTWQAMLMLLGAIGPGLAALIETSGENRRRERKILCSAVWNWKVGYGWPLLAVVGPLALAWFSAAITLFIVGSFPKLDSPLHWMRLFLVNLPFTPLWEEMGWRGFLLPRLESNRTALQASVLVAFAWLPWHLPKLLLFDAGIPLGVYLALFSIQVFAMSILLTWMCNRLGGRLIGVILFHGSFNASLNYFMLDTTGQTRTVFMAIEAGALTVAAIIVVVSAGAELGRERPRPIEQNQAL
jgi:membrane protease YdiL (CAAX protease family)